MRNDPGGRPGAGLPQPGTLDERARATAEALPHTSSLRRRSSHQALSVTASARPARLTQAARHAGCASRGQAARGGEIARLRGSSSSATACRPGRAAPRGSCPPSPSRRPAGLRTGHDGRLRHGHAQTPRRGGGAAAGRRAARGAGHCRSPCTISEFDGRVNAATRRSPGRYAGRPAPAARCGPGHWCLGCPSGERRIKANAGGELDDCLQSDAIRHRARDIAGRLLGGSPIAAEGMSSRPYPRTPAPKLPEPARLKPACRPCRSPGGPSTTTAPPRTAVPTHARPGTHTAAPLGLRRDGLGLVRGRDARLRRRPGRIGRQQIAP
jgi:hypothetical protein